MRLLTLRWRIFLTLLPLLLLIGSVGGAGTLLLYRLGGSIDEILRENYASVIAMERLNESLERIDSSFQLALAGKEEMARKQYRENLASYEEHMRTERNNITLPGEDELVAHLQELSLTYHEQAGRFYSLPPSSKERDQLYFGGGPETEGLLHSFAQIKQVSSRIRRLNQENMEQASTRSQWLATHSLLWFGLGLALAVALAGLQAVQTIRTIVRPIQAVTHSALAISRGNLDQVVPVQSHDEMGELADAFNLMARQLRYYRQTNYARVLKAQQTSQATIDSFPDPIVVVDLEGRVEMANQAAGRLLGLIHNVREPAAGSPWQPPEPLRGPLGLALQKQQAYLPERFDQAVSLQAEGREHQLLPQIVPIRDELGETLGAAVHLQDVTRFQLLDQLKSHLVATVSHQLKTPLTSIRLALHLLLEETVGPLTSKQTELLLDARDNAERLLATINNLLNLARLESSQQWLDLQPQAPAALLHSAADAIMPRAHDSNVTVTVEASEDLPAVNVDVGRLGLALANLVDNSLAHTPTGGSIRLTASSQGDQVTLSVNDTGVGIPEEYLPHVFERFFRVPGQSRDTGTGLGLAIAQEIVTAHGGSMSCESQAGKGATFRIHLPAAAERPASDRVLGHALPGPA